MADDGDDAVNRCFVGGLAWDTDERRLEETCSAYGEVLDVEITTDSETGTASGFVTFVDRESMRDAIEEMNGMELDGSNITINEEIKGSSPAAAHGGRPCGENCIFVGGLATATDERTLRRKFEHDEILDVKIIRDCETGISRGFGFVTFVHKSSVDAAVQGLHGKQLDGGTLLVMEHKPRRT